MTEWYWPNSVITRVIDGDSMIAKLTRDIGFHGSVSFEQRLRLNRINTAPKSTDLGAKATTFVTDCVNDRLVNITTVKPYKYGDEWMAEIELPGGYNLSDVLVDKGMAVYWDGQGPRPLGEGWR
jgi:endonuclease YncB( thermonuclease family)